MGWGARIGDGGVGMVGRPDNTRRYNDMTAYGMTFARHQLLKNCGHEKTLAK